MSMNVYSQHCFSFGQKFSEKNPNRLKTGVVHKKVLWNHLLSGVPIFVDCRIFAFFFCGDVISLMFRFSVSVGKLKFL